MGRYPPLTGTRASRHPALPGLAVRSGLCAAVGMLAAAAQAQPAEAGVPARTWTLSPYASLEETITSNHDASASRQVDAITRISAGVALRGRASPRLGGFVDYSLSQNLYARHSESNALQHDLSSGLQGRWLDGRIELDAGVAINRRALSPFGASGSRALATANSARQTSWRIAPGINGYLGRDVAYTGRLSYVDTRVNGQTVGDSRLGQASLRLQPTREALLTALADFQHATVDYRGGRSISSDRAFGTLSYRLGDLDMRLGANAGVEYSDLLTASRQRYTTWGLTALWLPSNRTRVDAGYTHRAFGNSHQVSAEHRTPFTIWRLTSLRDVNYGGALDLPGSQGPAFNLFFNLLASIPDAGQRANRAVELLQRLDPTMDLSRPLDKRFLAGAATLDGRQQLSAAWRGPRDTATLAYTHSKSRRIDPLATALDLLVSQGEVTTDQLSLNLAHLLTRDASMLMQADASTAHAALTDLRSRQWQLSLGLALTLGPHVKGVLGVRHGQYNVQPSATSESAVTAALTARY